MKRTKLGSKLNSMVVVVVGLLLLILSTIVSVADGAPQYEILMVGNKLTDEDKVEDMLEALLREGYGLSGVGEDDSVFAMRFEMSGYQLKQYLSNYNLLSQTITGKHWNWVILQEQSEVPGFRDTGVANLESLYKDSLEAITTLNNMISKANEGNAQTVLLMTWGHEDGDDYNSAVYQNYTIMQQRVADGYYAYRDAISTAKRPVKIAPVGLAYKSIYDSVLADDSIERPTAPGTDFSNLYDIDGRHPTVQGTYLIACVLYATLTGNDPIGLSYKPSSIDDSTKTRLQTVASTTVSDFDHVKLKPSSSSSGTNSQPSQEEEGQDGGDTSSSSTPAYKSSSDEAAKSSKSFSRFFRNFLLFGILLGGAYFLWQKRQQQQDIQYTAYNTGYNDAGIAGGFSPLTPNIEMNNWTTM